MSLIKCSKCYKEISNKAKFCPFCGYPTLINNNNLKSEKDGLKPDKQKNTKNKAITLCVLIGILLTSTVVGYLLYNKNQAVKEYKRNFSTALSSIKKGMKKASDLTELTAKVWFDTVNKSPRDETLSYVLNDERPRNYYNRYNQDFNVSIAKLYDNFQTKEVIRQLKVNRSYIAKHLKLINPPIKEYEKCYITLSEIYIEYLELTDLAFEPDGSYSSYTNVIEAKTKNFEKLIRKLNLQIPN